MDISHRTMWNTSFLLPLVVTDAILNLALSCSCCNGSKATKIAAIDPITKKEVPLFHPRKEVWSDHFAWSEDYLKIVGKTATGRATVAALKMNQKVTVNLRRVTMGLTHPPENFIQK